MRDSLQRISRLARAGESLMEEQTATIQRLERENLNVRTRIAFLLEKTTDKISEIEGRILTLDATELTQYKRWMTTLDRLYAYRRSLLHVAKVLF